MCHLAWKKPLCRRTDCREKETEEREKFGGEEERVKKRNPSRSLVAHACNPGYSEGRDQEDQSQTGQIVGEILSQKKTQHKKELVEWLKCRP
jgi:hypothetical protein